MSAHAHNPAVLHHFADAEQQKESATLGMWLFLATEVLLFAGLFLVYTLFRWKVPYVWVKESYLLGITLGGINTAVLICSSLTMALGVHAAQEGKKKALIGWLLATMLLGATFLGVKAIEYHEHWEHHKVPGLNFTYTVPYDNAHPYKVPEQQVFHFLYFCMTGIHGLHMVAGLSILTVIAIMAYRDKFSTTYYTPVEMAGLYWHFVDIVWVFLFPLLYLTGNHYTGGH